MFLRKYFPILTLLLLCGMAAKGQNVPVTGTSPSGSVSEITPPALPYLWSGINFTLTTAPMFAVTSEGVLDIAADQDVKQSYTFLDGFSRVYETVQSNVSLQNGTYRHAVQFTDTRFQRDQYSFLPYSATYFGLNNYVYETQKTYYNNLYPGEGYTSYGKTANTSEPGRYKSTSYAPGKSQIGQGRGTTSTRMTNAAGEVRTWELDGSGNPVSTGTYNAGELFGEEVIAPAVAGSDNAAAPISRVFTDKDGHVVLKMVSDSSYVTGGGALQVVRTFLSTYYVYDEMGHLRYTIPPRATALAEATSWTLNSTRINNLCFQYRYDNKGRLIQQRFPGEESFTALVYDRKQRVVMRQSPKEAISQDYEVTIYDKLNRVIATALYHDLSSRQEWQDFFDNYNGSLASSEIRHYMGYPNEGLYPPETGVLNITILGYTYYDNYEVSDPGNTQYTTYNNQLNFSADYQSTFTAENPVRSMRSRGQVTGSKLRILASPNANHFMTGDWTWNRNYYDDKGRTINSLKQDYHANGVQIHFKYGGIQYNFLNQPLISKSIFQNLYVSYTVYPEWSKNEYQTGTGALLTSSHKVNNGPWTVTSRMEYDDLGRVQRKSLGNYGEVQDLSYNIRGQLTGINENYALTGNKAGESRTFGEAIRYDYGFANPQYNGKIAGIIWRGNNTTTNHAYGYDYDLLGRLKNAEYRTNNATTWNKTSLDYTVSNLVYDKNGNLKSMDQQGVTPTSGIQTIDKLRYNYENNEESNRLQRVADAMPDYNLGDFVNTNGSSNDYSYDANGNLAADANKGIDTIIYTFFDKPQVIKFHNNSSIEYSYDAAGNKIQELVTKTDNSQKATDYIAGYVYENNQLQYINTAEGRTVRTTISDDFKEEFFVKDHLGNVRSTIDVVPKALQQYLATYELASANLEGLLFEQLNEIRSDNPASTDPANLKSGRLNGQDQPIGTSLLMHVMAGDQVEMNVNSFYDSYNPDDDNPVTAGNMLTSIVSTLTGGVGGFQGSEGHNPDMVSQLFTPGNYLNDYNNIINTATDGSKPKAYLNYVLFDENMRIDKSFSNAFQVNSNGSWEQIGTASPLTIPTNGYLAVYLSNQSKGINCYDCATVNFDQLVIRLQKGRQLEETHYYPFGLPMAGLSTAADNNTIAQRRKYQGNEYIKELGLNWMDFQARQYDPQLGRFLGVDPLAASGGQDMFSPYAAMGNAPESMVDPNGEQSRVDPSLQSYVHNGAGGEGDNYGTPGSLPATGHGSGNYTGGNGWVDGGVSAFIDQAVKNTAIKEWWKTTIANGGTGTAAGNFITPPQVDEDGVAIVYGTRIPLSPFQRKWRSLKKSVHDLLSAADKALQGDSEDKFEKRHKKGHGGIEFTSKTGGTSHSGYTVEFPDGKSVNVDNMLTVMGNFSASGFGWFSAFLDRMGNFTNAGVLIEAAFHKQDSNSPQEPLQFSKPYQRDTIIWLQEENEARQYRISPDSLKYFKHAKFDHNGYYNSDNVLERK